MLQVKNYEQLNVNGQRKRIFADVILPLLSHYMTEIRQEMYELCQKKVITAVGPKLNATREGAPGTQILFLLQPEILTEIALNGLTSEDQKVRFCTGP